jgi:uncharacterized protein YqeY
MTIKDQITHDLKEAMRAREKRKLDALRLITAAIKQIEVDERIEVDDPRLLVILDKLAKQRNESITQFKSAARQDLVEQEEFELDLIKHYLPEPLSESEIAQMIEHTIKEIGAEKISDMGKVMAVLKPQMQGKADMSKVSALIKSQLS